MPHRHLIAKILLLVFLATGITQAAKSKAPAAPSNLKVTVLGVNAFKLEWKDNSNNELGWDVSVSLKGGKPKHYLYIPIKDITSYTVITNDLPGFGLVFQIAAYNGASGAEVISPPSELVSVTAQSPSKFDAPTGLTARPVDDGRVRLQWEDNSTSESGYQIQVKGPYDNKWRVIGAVGPELKYNLVVPGFEPLAKFMFRVRGLRGVTFATNFSNTANMTTRSLRAPAQLEAIPEAEGGFKFKWKDRSSAETGFELQRKIGNGDFISLGNLSANISSAELNKDFVLDTDMEFRIRSIRDVEIKVKVDGVDKVERILTLSKFSNVFAVRSSRLNKPTGLVDTARTDSSITLSWADTSNRETGYQIDYRKKGTTAFTTEYAAANSKTYTIKGLDAFTDYEFKLRTGSFDFFSKLPSSFSDYTSMVEAKTRHGVMPVESSPLVSAGPFTYQIQLTDLATLSDLVVTGLPDGLTFDKATRTISGSLNQETGFSFTVIATFNDGSTSTRAIKVNHNGSPAKPTSLTVNSFTDTSVELKWEDNSKIESGYQLEYREVGSTDFSKKMVPVNAQVSTITGLKPATNYEFRVSAIGAQAGKFSVASELVSRRTREGVIGNLKPVFIPNVTFSYQIQVSDLSMLTDLAVTGLPIGLTFDEGTRTVSGIVNKDRGFSFKVIATFSDGSMSTRDIDVLHGGVPAAPTLLAATSSTDTSIALSWEDNSIIETGYQIEYREVGSSVFIKKTVGANIKASTITELAPGRNYEFKVSAVGAQAGTISLPSELVSRRTRDAVIGNLVPAIIPNVAFSYQIQLSGVDQLTSLTVIGLPPELTYNPLDRTITGTVTFPGHFLIELKATFSDLFISTRILKLSISTPPIIASSFDSKNLAVGASVVVPATGKFSDPDTTSAERFQTTKGAFDIIFFPSEAPLTVDNFIAYLNAGEYNNMFFHRAPPNFVVQGGGYKHSTANGFSGVVKFPSVLNEPGISNVRGTVAMAKVPDLPNSATSEWFINVKDNSANLDFQNGGFTVFGRVPAAGMVVVDAIKNLPIRNYDITVGANTIGFTDVPTDVPAPAPAVLDPTKLVKVLSSAPAPILTYSVTSQNTAIATATVAGTNITINGVAAGSTNIEVKATDLDGNFVTQSIPVTVP